MIQNSRNSQCNTQTTLLPKQIKEIRNYSDNEAEQAKQKNGELQAVTCKDQHFLDRLSRADREQWAARDGRMQNLIIPEELKKISSGCFHVSSRYFLCNKAHLRSVCPFPVGITPCCCHLAVEVHLEETTFWIGIFYCWPRAGWKLKISVYMLDHTTSTNLKLVMTHFACSL